MHVGACIHAHISVCRYDRPTSLHWARFNWKAYVDKRPNTEFLMFMDNLDSQTTDQFKNKLESLGTKVWFGPSGMTNTWQPVVRTLSLITNCMV